MAAVASSSIVPASSAPPASAAVSTSIVAPPELEATLSLLTSHRSVLGYILLSRPQGDAAEETAAIIRHSGVIFEGEQGRKYARAIARIVDSVREGLDEIGGEDDIRFMRIRTKRHEIMISPDPRYLLAVLHDPSS